MKHNNKANIVCIVAILLLVGVLLMSVHSGVAQPTGAQLTYISNSSKNLSYPDNRTDGKGTITIVNMNAEQQNSKWKAYVGNISSTFVLDDENDYSIYQWTIESFSGEVYMSRDSSVTWGSIACASIANKQAEDTALTHTSSAADSVNRTFGTQAHAEFDVGSTNIPASSCWGTATWQNDTVATPGITTAFTEVILWDGDAAVYTTFVENDALGYRDDSPQSTYDFQAIVPENATSSAADLTYFFYLELS